MCIRDSNISVKELRKAIKEADTAIENLWRGIELGQSVEMLTERINQRKAEKAELEEQLAICLLYTSREIYSGYEPSWRYAHAASIWIKGMEDEGVIPKPQKILKSSNVDEDLGYISEEEISETFTWLVPKIMAKHNMNEIIAVAAEYRCFEDFDYRKSRQKIDFYRKWYHTRAKISVESLDELKEKYAKNTDGIEWDIADDSVCLLYTSRCV